MAFSGAPFAKALQETKAASAPLCTVSIEHVSPPGKDKNRREPSQVVERFS